MHVNSAVPKKPIMREASAWKGQRSRGALVT